MKVAAGIISLVFALLVFMQSCAVGLGGSALENQATEQAGGIGVMLAFMMIIGGAFAFKLPLVAAILYALGGLVGVAADQAAFPDLRVWSIGVLILAGLCFVAFWLERRQKRVQQKGAS